MSYSLLMLRRAQRELADVPPGAYEPIVTAIRSLADVPRPPRCAKLTGREGWRIRIGEYRVIYEIDDAQQTITILHIGNRRDVYR